MRLFFNNLGRDDSLHLASRRGDLHNLRAALGQLIRQLRCAPAPMTPLPQPLQRYLHEDRRRRGADFFLAAI